MAYFVLLSIFQRNIPPSETSPVLGKIRCCPQIVVAAIETQKTSQFFGNYSVAKQKTNCSWHGNVLHPQREKSEVYVVAIFHETILKKLSKLNLCLERLFSILSNPLQAYNARKMVLWAR